MGSLAEFLAILPFFFLTGLFSLTILHYSQGCRWQNITRNKIRLDRHHHPSRRDEETNEGSQVSRVIPRLSPVMSGVT